MKLLKHSNENLRVGKQKLTNYGNTLVTTQSMRAHMYSTDSQQKVVRDKKADHNLKILPIICKKLTKNDKDLIVRIN